MYVGIAGTLSRTVVIAADESFKYVGHYVEQGMIWWLLSDRSVRMRRLARCLNGLARRVLGPMASSTDLWPKITAFAVGISGTDFRDEVYFREVMDSLPFNGEIILSSIGEASYCGGCLMKPGILIRAGTGTTIYGIDCHRQRKIANAWGPVLGDQGSGFAMAVELLRTAACYEDGRLRTKEAEEICNAITERCGCRTFVEVHERLFHLQEFYGPDAFTREIIELTQDLFRLASSGNQTAIGIVRSAAAELVKSVKAVVNALDFAHAELVPVCFAGNVLCRYDLLQETVVDDLSSLGAQMSKKFVPLPAEFVP